MNGVMQPFSTSLPRLIKNLGGYGSFLRSLLLNRFEIFSSRNTKKAKSLGSSRQLSKAINLFFSQYSSVNNKIVEMERYFLIRLLLIKSSRGRSHALGKPARGQRTWSNAWTAYNYNRTTRSFVNHFQRIAKQEDRVEKKNYKLIQIKKQKKQISLVKKSNVVNI